MRSAANDECAAIKALGPALTDAFLSLVADLKGVTHLGELADVPAVISDDGVTKLHFVLKADAHLELEPLGKAIAAPEGWRLTHRARLLRVCRGGIVLL